MDIVTIIRTAFTVIVFVTFLGIVIWAYSAGRRGAFERAARMPIEDDEIPGHAVKLERSGK
ncbi:MAG: cbb3-type cytochrome oxidase subunit 3 [Burkholderiales bacterium]